MANKNITQLTPQVGSAAATTLLYAVTGSTGSYVDTSLPLSVFVNNLGLTGIPTVPTATLGTNTTQISSTAFVQAQITSALTTTLLKANNLSDVANVTTALTNLGAAAIASNTFTGTQTIASSNPILAFNATSGTTLGTVNFQTSGSNRWQIQPTTSSFVLARYVAGTFTDSPIIVANATGVTTFTQRPVFGSATPWDSANLNFATPPAIGGTTPAAGAFTTLSATGLITPSSTVGIKGTTTNDSAQAGSVGEYVTATGSAVSLTTGTAANITSISLTAGDWDVWAGLLWQPAGTTTMTAWNGQISQTSATFSPALPSQTATSTQFSAAAGAFQSSAVPSQRLSLSGTTTVFLVANAAFSVSTLTASGTLSARRRR